MARTQAVLLVVSVVTTAGCSLIVPSSRDFTYGEEGVDAGPSEDGGVNDPDASCPMTCGGVCTDTQRDPLHCGNCATSCSAPDNATPTCDEARCGFTCSPGYYAVLGTCEPRLAPRPIAPLSTATATSRRPTFRWELPARADGARIEICADRACTSVLQVIDAAGSQGRPTTDLPTGVVFWRLFGRTDGEVGIEPSPTWQVYIGARSAPVDTSWGTTLDINGDGYSDLAIGAPRAGSGGVVYVYLGTASGLDESPRVVLNGPDDLGVFGESLACAGDLDGDGFPELLVGARGFEDYRGRAFVFLGGSDFGSEPSPVADRIFESPTAQAMGSFGGAVAGVGDLNGDGYGDVAIGASGQDNPEVDEGVVYVYFGQASARSAASFVAHDLAIDSPFDTAYSEFGRAVAGAGDVNGDGYADLFIGAHFDGRPELREGAAYLS